MRNWMYDVNKREAERGNPQAVNWMNSLPPLAPQRQAGWTPMQGQNAGRSGFTPAAGYSAPAGRPQYVQAQRYGNPARPAYQPPPQTPQQRVVYQMMAQKGPPAYNANMPIAANASMGAVVAPPMHR